MEPLAAKIRPRTLDTFVGQLHLVGKDAPLRVAIEERHLFSFILWGPPGVGKTTLARIYASALNADYHELSAVSAGKDDIREIIEKTGTLLGPKMLFLDEIHRFNKAQQDYLLPFVETGQLTLIGATTENPSFEVISPLLSRSRVFTLHELTAEEITKIIRTDIPMDKDAKAWIAQVAHGDARQALALIEHTQKLYGTISIDTLTKSLQDTKLRFDKGGEEHYNTISAFIKSMRASQPDAALYYLARMIEGGEDPKFIARRMVIFASEDIGMRDAQALLVAEVAFRAAETVGYPEVGIILSHATIYLSQAPKTKAVYYAYLAAMEDAKKHGNLPIPLKIRNAATKLMKDIGYGKDYKKYTKEDLLPEKLKGTVYWQPSKKEKE
ncbi:MAG TPA: replication-associated recombination protein A [Candidatus Paceibacterota bacterium]|nr:replication-associated recombination protein A [Candidatus Paceibacterota bacterium]